MLCPRLLAIAGSFLTPKIRKKTTRMRAISHPFSIPNKQFIIKECAGLSVCQPEHPVKSDWRTGRFIHRKGCEGGRQRFAYLSACGRRSRPLVFNALLEQVFVGIGLSESQVDFGPELVVEFLQFFERDGDHSAGGH